MKKFIAIFIAVSVVGFFLPYVANAGLVPCGNAIDDPDQPGDQTVECEFCHLFILFDKIVRFVLFRFVPPVAVLMLVIGGAMFFFAAGNPRYLEQGKGILTSVVLGLVIIYGAWLLVNMFFVFIGVSSWTGLDTGWFSFNCITPP